MASFSFGAGNLGKLLRIPLYLAGRIGVLLVPRGRLWVFGCGAGIGDGALALWNVVRAHGHDAVWLTGSDQEESDAAALGIRTLPKNGLRGWWATARAGVVVVTHGFGDVNRYATADAFVVQLWHGIPLKRIGLDSPETTRLPAFPGSRFGERLLRALYRRAAQRIQVLPAASHRSRGRLESAFGLPPGRVVVTGEPRVDVLSAGAPAQRRKAASDRLHAVLGDTGPAGKNTRHILYAPTWRDGAPDPAVPSAAEWVQIVSLLERREAVLLVRPHPLGAGAYTPPFPTRRVRMLTSDVVVDVTPLLPAIDVLVTDYSSLVFDVGLLAMPVVLLAPDAAEYARTRGFYGRFEDVAGSDAAGAWPEVVAELERLLGHPKVFTARSARSRTLSEQMHAYRDGRGAERVYEVALRRSGLAPEGAR